MGYETRYFLKGPGKKYESLLRSAFGAKFESFIDKIITNHDFVSKTSFIFNIIDIVVFSTI